MSKNEWHTKHIAHFVAILARSGNTNNIILFLPAIPNRSDVNGAFVAENLSLCPEWGNGRFTLYKNIHSNRERSHLGHLYTLKSFYEVLSEVLICFCSVDIDKGLLGFYKS